MKDFRRKKRRGGKLDYRWEGPFVITNNLGKGLFRLNQINGDKVHTCIYMIVLIQPIIYIMYQVVKRVNGAHLKRFNVNMSGNPPDSSCTSMTINDSIPPLPPPIQFKHQVHTCT